MMRRNYLPCKFLVHLYHLLTHTHDQYPFFIQLCYFLILSLMGLLALKVTNPTTTISYIDLFFTSVSSATVSSASVVEMEVFTNAQLIIITILMLLGGEIFVSMIGIQFRSTSLKKNPKPKNNSIYQFDVENRNDNVLDNKVVVDDHDSSGILKNDCIKCLGYVVLGYLLVILISGSSLVSIYISLVPSARKIIETKGIKIQTFSIFTTVSTFANCGFIPTNENMIVFKKNSGLLLLLIPQILLGNTLFPSALRFFVWVLGKLSKKIEFSYILENYKEMGYQHLFSAVDSCLLVSTVFGFILIQLILFCSMEWKSEAMVGLSYYQRLVACLFQIVNSRHAGESVVDISTLSTAILVLSVFMIYLPPYTSFQPYNIRDDHNKVSLNEDKVLEGKRRKVALESLMFSQLSYLVIFIILICIIEREKLKTDPLNFNVLNITIEVISAYGNVGWSTGYSCKRQLKPERDCTDKWYGLSGKLSGKGKLIIIIVMVFGRLKSFSNKGGKSWKLF